MNVTHLKSLGAARDDLRPPDPPIERFAPGVRSELVQATDRFRS